MTAVVGILTIRPSNFTERGETLGASVARRTATGGIAVLVHLLAEKVAPRGVVAGVQLRRLEDRIALIITRTGSVVGDVAAADAVGGRPGDLREVANVEVEEVEALGYGRRGDLYLVVPLLDDVRPLDLRTGARRLVDVQVLADELVAIRSSTVVAVVFEFALVGVHLRHVGQLRVPLHLEHVRGAGEAQLRLIAAGNQISVVIVHLDDLSLFRLGDAPMGNLAAIWPQTGSMVAIELGVLGATGKRRLFRVLSTVGGNLAEEDDQNGGNGDQLQLKLTTSHSGV